MIQAAFIQAAFFKRISSQKLFQTFYVFALLRSLLHHVTTVKKMMLRTA